MGPGSYCCNTDWSFNGVRVSKWNHQKVKTLKKWNLLYFGVKVPGTPWGVIQESQIFFRSDPYFGSYGGLKFWPLEGTPKTLKSHIWANFHDKMAILVSIFLTKSKESVGKKIRTKKIILIVFNPSGSRTDTPEYQVPKIFGKMIFFGSNFLRRLTPRLPFYHENWPSYSFFGATPGSKFQTPVKPKIWVRAKKYSGYLGVPLHQKRANSIFWGFSLYDDFTWNNPNGLWGICGWWDCPLIWISFRSNSSKMF